MATVVLEETLKYKDGRKWKSRWGVLRRLSPVAVPDPWNAQNAAPDRLHISFFKDQNDQKKNNAEKSSIALEDFYGIESKFSLDKEHHVLAIVCQKQVVLLAFQTRQSLIKWETGIRSHLGDEKKFKVKIDRTPPQAKFPAGAATVFILGERICVTTGQPPRVLGAWHVTDLRKYGTISNKFCFEAGSRCGKLAGLFTFVVEQPQQVENSLKNASQRNLSRSRPSLRSSFSADSRSHLNNASVISSSFEPPLPSPSYSSNHTSNYADLSLVNEEEEEEEEGPGVTLVHHNSEYPSVRYSDSSRVHVVDSSRVHVVDSSRVHVPDSSRVHVVDSSRVHVPDSSRVHVVDAGYAHVPDQTHASSSAIFSPRAVICDPRVPPPGQPPPLHPQQQQQRVPSGKSPGKDYVQYARLNLDSLKAARRYSCGDVIESPTREEYSGAAGPDVSGSGDAEVSDVYSIRNMQRNLDELAPKLSHCASGERQKSATLPNSSRRRASGYAVESHGRQPSSTSSNSNSLAGSVDLADAILRVCHDPMGNSSSMKSSSTSSGSSTRDLAENTPTVSCKVGKRANGEGHHQGSRQVITCGNCGAVLVREDGRLEACKCSMHGYDSHPGTERYTHHVHSSSLRHVQTEPILRHTPPLTHPLQPVNFSRYDGVDDGEYLYWMKGAAERAQAPVFSDVTAESDRLRGGSSISGGGGGSGSPKHSATKFSAASVASKLLRDPQYVNLPPEGAEVEGKKGGKQKAKQWKNKLMTIHDSLRRPKHKSGGGGGSGGGERPKLDDGTYVKLADDGGDHLPLSRLRGKSLENVLSGMSGIESPRASRSGSQSSLPGTPVRNRRTGKRLPPPFEPAPAPPPAAPYKSGDDDPAGRGGNNSEHIYAVPVVSARRANTALQVFKPVQPYANQNLLCGHLTNQNLLSSHVAPQRRQTVCSSEFSHRRHQQLTRDTVFVNVELPSRSSHNHGHSHSDGVGTHVPRYDALTLEAAGDRHHEAAYLQMNMSSAGGGVFDVSRVKSLGRSASVQEGPNRLRPKLHHSRSLDNELDADGGSYLEMNVGNNTTPAASRDTTTSSTLPHASVILEDSFSNYLPMMPGASGYAGGPPQRAPTKPFDNLIVHHHHSAKPPPTSVRPLAASNKSSEEKTSSTDEETEKASSGKTPGLLSRLIRRNSSHKDVKEKERKQSRTEELAASSTISTVPEVPDVIMDDDVIVITAPPPVPVTSQQSRESDPDIHEHVPLASGYRTRSNSQHAVEGRRLAPLPERQHSYTYLDPRHLEMGDNTNLEGGQGDSCSSLLDLPPAPPPPLPNRAAEAARAEDVNGNPPPSTDAAVPLLPPKTYRESDYTEMNVGTRHKQQAGSGSAAVAPDAPRPKMPTPEPEERARGTPPPLLPTKAGQVKRTSNLGFEKSSESTPLLAPASPAHTSGDLSAAHVVYYNESAASPLASPSKNCAKKAPNLRVNVPASISATISPGRVISRSESARHAEEEDSDIWMMRELPYGSADSRRGTFSSSHSVPVPSRGRIDSCHSDSSVSTSGSTDTFHSTLDEHKPSPATCTLRPRSGKEYQRLDRRKLAEVLDVPLSGDSSLRTTPQSPITPSQASSSVFNFDMSSMESGHTSFLSVYSSGDDASPKVAPSVYSRQSSHRAEPHTYVNCTFPKTESPRFLDTPPASPRFFSKIPEQANPQLNYAEIDLSDAGDGGKGKALRKPVKRDGATEYAMIDMLATAAASKVGREHAKHREDSLRRKTDSLRRSESDARDILRGGKERRSLMTAAGGSTRRDRASLMRSASSASTRDRKASNSSFN